MPEKYKDEGFTVSDRRSFSSEGESRPETAPDEVVQVKPQTNTAPITTSSQHSAMPSAATLSSAMPTSESVEQPLNQSLEQPSGAPPPPTAAEQTEQADAYRETNLSMDEAITKELGHGAADLEITFERFLGSIYMTALMQMGMAHEPGGQPRLDILGARQTIDTLGLLADKTKGNLTPAEQNFLQNALYELRMAYLEVTNAIARGPQPGAPGPVLK